VRLLIAVEAIAVDCIAVEAIAVEAIAAEVVAAEAIAAEVVAAEAIAAEAIVLGIAAVPLREAPGFCMVEDGIPAKPQTLQDPFSNVPVHPARLQRSPSIQCSFALFERCN
jgi:hypothetical protein